jgi:hypothetical protein
MTKQGAISSAEPHHALTRRQNHTVGHHELSTVNRLLTVPTACSTPCSAQRTGEEMGMDMDMDMDEIRMILAVRALRKLLNKGDRGDRDELVTAYRALGEAIVENKPMTRKNRARVAEYLREAG